jgi:hypothetical protein
MPQADTETTAVCGIPILFEIKLRAYRYRVFCSGRHMIQTCPNLSCLTAEKRFMLFKGPGSFKKSLKKLQKCRVFKGLSIDTAHYPPFKWLDNTFNLVICRLISITSTGSGVSYTRMI